MYVGYVRRDATHRSIASMQSNRRPPSTPTPKPNTNQNRRSAFLLGHTASVGTCLALSADGALLASGDRDEKVRVSRFPCTLVVQGYLTGEFNDGCIDFGCG